MRRTGQPGVSGCDPGRGEEPECDDDQDRNSGVSAQNVHNARHSAGDSASDKDKDLIR
jgi:hypothetical protein